MTFLRVVGKVTVEVNGQTKEATHGSIIDTAATVKSFDKSFALLGYGEGHSSKIKIGANTSFDLSKFELNLPEQKEGLKIKINAGDVLFKIFNPNKIKSLIINTNIISMGIRGTTFFVRSNDKSSLLLVKEGTVEMENNTNQNSSFVYADSGFEVNANGAAKPANLNQFNINWDPENEQPEIEIVKTDIGPKIEIFIKELKKQISDDSNDLENKKASLINMEKANELELIAVKKDTACIKNGLNDCRLLSKLFIHDILYNREDAKNFFTPVIKKGLLEDIEKYKAKLPILVSNAQSAISDLEKEIADLQKKYEPAQKKWDEFSSLAEAEKEKSKRAYYKEIIEILDDNTLRDALNR